MYLPVTQVLVFFFLFFLDNCETWTDIDPSYNKNIPIRAMKWFETPSVVRYGAGNSSQFARRWGGREGFFY